MHNYAGVSRVSRVFRVFRVFTFFFLLSFTVFWGPKCLKCIECMILLSQPNNKHNQNCSWFDPKINQNQRSELKETLKIKVVELHEKPQNSCRTLPKPKK